MNALEELRQMADLQECGKAFVEIGQLRDIADRIEAEYMELPKDADGVPCKIGDHVKSGETCGDIKEMLLYKRDRERWEVYLTTLDDSVSADSLHHVKPESDDTLAKIFEDMDVYRAALDELADMLRRLDGVSE